MRQSRNILRNVLAALALMAAIAAAAAYTEIPERPGHALETVLNASEDAIRFFDEDYGKAVDEYRSKRRKFVAFAALSVITALGAVAVHRSVRDVGKPR